MSPQRMRELAGRGWRLIRDGSTATAALRGTAPDGAPGWEIRVLLTLGHPARWTLDVEEESLSECGPDAARTLSDALEETLELLRDWRGETLEDDST